MRALALDDSARTEEDDTAALMRHSLYLVCGFLTLVVLSCRKSTGRGDAEAIASVTPATSVTTARDEASLKNGPKSKASMKCSAFQGESGFVEAYVDFMLATRSEVVNAFPMAKPTTSSLRSQQRDPTDEQLRRGEYLRDKLPRLSCLSMTDVELDALGDALHIPRLPEPETLRTPTNGTSAKQLGRLLGSPLRHTKSTTPKSLEGTHYFRAILAEPSSCLVIYEAPGSITQALREAGDAVALGQSWNSAIVARSPSPAIEIPSTTRKSKDPRDREEEWQSIARDLIEFVRTAGSPESTLYVEIEYDC